MNSRQPVALAFLVSTRPVRGTGALSIPAAFPWPKCIHGTGSRANWECDSTADWSSAAVAVPPAWNASSSFSICSAHSYRW